VKTFKKTLKLSSLYINYDALCTYQLTHIFHLSCNPSVIIEVPNSLNK